MLGEVLAGRKKGGTGSACGYFKDGVGVTDKGQIAEGFCEFYSQVGPKLMRRIKKGMRPSCSTWGIAWKGLCSGYP